MSEANAAVNPQASQAGASAEGVIKTRAPASNFLNIVRGRLPLLFVHAVRFDEVLAKMGNKDLASKLATSIGKVFDIRKGRNFSYIGKDYKPSTDDIAAAKAWIEAVGKENAKGLTAQGDVKVMTDLVAQYEARGLATAQDVAQLSEARSANRAPRQPKAAATPAATGETTAEAPKGAAEELLS